MKKKYNVECPYCHSDASLNVDSSVVYRKDYGPIYLCDSYPSCDSYVGCHPGSVKPLGRLANRELRFWKKEAHAHFDKLWKEEIFEKRTLAYTWLSIELGIPKKEAHIGMFDVDICKKVVEISKKRYDE